MGKDSSEMAHEKRKYTRFKVQDKVYAALGINFSKVGKLQDISMDGLAFQYIEETKNISQKSSMIAIFHSEDMFFLPNLACTIIADQPICENVKMSNAKSRYVAKKCAVRFKGITTYQRDKLEFLINHYTCGLAPFLNEFNA